MMMVCKNDDEMTRNDQFCLSQFPVLWIRNERGKQWILMLVVQKKDGENPVRACDTQWIIFPSSVCERWRDNYVVTSVTQD